MKEMIGSTFSSLFDNMDAKWLRCYERAALYGEKMEIEEYSPEREDTAQLDTIDEAKAELADEELAQLDLTRYDAAVAKMMALMGMD